ncbi:MAG: zinc ribbon domain-containing protein [Elusimicrobia bacterium]|nr:zinc ribbon domain-containing protein [Elusimicrobiota bacterium]
MIRCPKCGKDNNDGCQVCYHCLESLKKAPRESPAPEPSQTVKAPASACPACGADNDADAAFCDQCGLPMSNSPEPAGCPECGGKVEESGDGRGVCTECGVELAEHPSPAAAAQEETPAAESPTAPAPHDLSQILSRKILEKLEAGMPLELAVETSCQECLPDAAGAAPKEDALAACPVCGTGNSPQAPRCQDCGISFEPARRPIPCPRCAKPCSEDTCPCGAIMTLSKLAGFVDPSVIRVCPRCKQLLTVDRKECPTCACDVISADRLKAYVSAHTVVAEDGK